VPVLHLSDVAVARRLRALSLEVRRGTVHALTGPNGAGKSTVLECVLGLLPFTGKVTLKLEGSRRLSVVPQRFAHAPVLPVSVNDFLAASRTNWPVALGVRAPLRARLDAVLEDAGLRDFGPRLLSELSGGELKRVLLANALEPKPELLLLDEPEAGLDAEGGAWLEQKLLALKAHGVTTLLVSHDKERVARLADTATAVEVVGPAKVQPRA
jgi:zinc transport system ATP-binding protein